MGTGTNKRLRRQDITFEEKDQSLRDDVRTLGAMVGDLIREQNGEELFELVENARLRSIRRREGNEKPGEELSALVRELDPATAAQLIRGFSTYFQMVNTAEKVHRIRRRRDYLRDVRIYQPGGLEDSLIKLKAAGKTIDDAAQGTEYRQTPCRSSEPDDDAAGDECGAAEYSHACNDGLADRRAPVRANDRSG